MIEIKDIGTAIVGVLKNNGYTVTANEVKEGFKKPTCFVEVLPISVTLQNQFTELVTVSVEIAYHPFMETKEEIITASEKLKNIFLYTPIAVADRFLSTDEIVFDYDKSVLYASFDIEFLQETPTLEEEIPKMENLYDRTVMESHGTSENTD